MYFYKRNAIFIYTKKRFNIVYVRKSRGTKWKQKEKGDEEERQRESDPHLGTHIRSIIYINVYVVECLYFLKKF